MFQKLLQKQQKEEPVNEQIFYKIKPKQYTKIRQFVLSFLLVLGCFGGLISLLRTNGSVLAESKEESAFLEMYVDAYYSFPKTETQEKFIKDFSLKPWSMAHSNDRKEMRVNNFQIAHIESFEDYTRYFFTVEITSITQDMIKKTDPITKSSTLYQQVDVVRGEAAHAFLVSSALQPFVKEYVALDADMVKKLAVNIPKGKEQVSDTEKQIIKDMITLFLETYNLNHEQALLFLDQMELPHKDSQVSMAFHRFASTTRDQNKYYVEAEVLEKYELFESNRQVYFEIDIKKQKICAMKIY